MAESVQAQVKLLLRKKSQCQIALYKNPAAFLGTQDLVVYFHILYQLNPPHLGTLGDMTLPSTNGLFEP